MNLKYERNNNMYVKAHVCGNDFIITDDYEIYNDYNDTLKERIQLLGNRHLGIGFDQFVIIQPIGDNRYKLKFYNQDGSEAIFCGNGTCSATLFIHTYLNQSDNQYVLSIQDNEYISQIDDQFVYLHCKIPTKVSDNVIYTGNYHMILHWGEKDNVHDFQKRFPDRTFHFIDDQKESVKVKHFERGVGWTTGCGSGCIAITYYLQPKKTLIIHQDGGTVETQLTSTNVILKVKSVIVSQLNLFI